MSQKEEPVLILGAGINGAALARELILNHVPVCLVDTSDIASGTTAYSSRLIHGGLRYLEHGELSLVRESLEERNRLLSLAPQYVQPLKILIPVRRRMGGLIQALSRFFGWTAKNPARPVPRGLWLVRLGLWLYDSIAKDPELPRHEVVGSNETSTTEIDKDKFPWFCSYWDAQVLYPELLTLALLQDARQIAEDNDLFFEVNTYSQAKLADALVEVQSTRMREKDHLESSQEIARPHFQPALIINATGAWVDETLQKLKIPSPQLIGGTRGTHLITPNSKLREQLQGKGIYLEAVDGRPVFILPLDDSTLIGTTDVPYIGDPAAAVADEEDIDYLLATVNEAFPSLHLTLSDISQHCCGVRPLPYVSSGSPSSITRRHLLVKNEESSIPIYSIIGGKITTCRSLAEEATTAILDRLGRTKITDSRKRLLPGSDDYPQDSKSLLKRQKLITERLSYSLQQVQSVWKLCGAHAEKILSEEKVLIDRENLSGTTLPCGYIRWVIHSQWVTTMNDLVERRLMLLYHENLRVETLMHLAKLMFEEGILLQESVDARVCECCERLKVHFGKQVIGHS